MTKKLYIKKFANTLSDKELDELLPTGFLSGLTQLFPYRQRLDSGTAKALAEASENYEDADSFSLNHPYLKNFTVVAPFALAGAALGGAADGSAALPGAILGSTLGGIVNAVHQNSIYNRVKEKAKNKALAYDKITANHLLPSMQRGALAAKAAVKDKGRKTLTEEDIMRRIKDNRGWSKTKLLLNNAPLGLLSIPVIGATTMKDHFYNMNLERNIARG